MQTVGECSNMIATKAISVALYTSLQPIFPPASGYVSSHPLAIAYQPVMEYTFLFNQVTRGSLIGRYACVTGPCTLWDC